MWRKEGTRILDDAPLPEDLHELIGLYRRQHRLTAPHLKLLMHLALTITFHCTIFFTIPLWSCDASTLRCAQGSDDCCTASGAVSGLYVFVCMYLFISGRQLRLGFPTILHDHALTNSGVWLNLFLFKMYMMIPFLWELRATMDWTVERTSLDLASYMQLEDVYTGLCLVRANLYHRRFHKGKTQPRANKACQGCGFVLALVVLTVGPLYLFSSVNPFFETNRILVASMDVRFAAAPSPNDFNSSSSHRFDYVDSTIGGFYSLGSMSRSDLSQTDDEILTSRFNFFGCISQKWEECGYSYLIGSRSGADFQTIRFPVATDKEWGINDHALDNLRSALYADSSNSSSMACRDLAPIPSNAVVLEVQIKWRRRLYVDGSNSGSITCARTLSFDERRAILDRIDSRSAEPVVLNGTFPKFIRIPSSVGSTPVALLGRNGVTLWHDLQNISLALVESRSPLRFDANRWWSLRQAHLDLSVFDVSPADGVQVIVGAETVAGGAAASSLTAGGILGFYIVVVYAIGRAVRGACGGSRYRLVVDELPEVQDLVDLCEAVHMARKQGNLKRETELHEMIQRIYRSPNMLLRLTGERLERADEYWMNEHNQLA